MNPSGTSEDSNLCEKTYFEKRFCHLSESNINSDCEFLVGPENVSIKGHKLIFSVASDVMQAMFYGDLKENKPIKIEDLDPEGFQGMKQFIYSGEIDFKSAMHALFIYLAARKYLIPQLRKECIKYIETNIKPSEVLEFYESCKTENATEFDKMCEIMIQEETHKVVKSEYFVKANTDTIDFILKSETLSLNSELDVFEHFERWALFAADHEEIGLENKGSSLNSLKKHIRFLTMNPTEFTSLPAKSALLTQEEKLAIGLNIMRLNSVPMPENLSLEQKPRSLLSTLIDFKELTYRYRISLVFSIDNPCKSCAEINYTLKPEINSVFNFSVMKFKKLVCFKWKGVVYSDSVDKMLKISTKLTVLAENSHHNIIFKDESKIMINVHRKELQQEVIIATIPKTELKRDIFLRGTNDQVSILVQFVVVELTL